MNLKSISKFTMKFNTLRLSMDFLYSVDEIDIYRKLNTPIGNEARKSNTP